MDMDTLTRFLAWSLVINFGFMAIWAVMMIIARDFLLRLQKIFVKMDDTELEAGIWRFMALFKALVIIFNLTPYLVLRLFM